MTVVVPASEPACQSRDWAWFKLTQPIVELVRAGTSPRALQLIDVTCCVEYLCAHSLDTVITYLVSVIVKFEF